MWDRIDANRLAVGAWETFTLIVHGPTGSDEGWKWVSSNPSPYSGAVSHQSNNVSGLHQHYFWGATQTLQVNAGDRLYTYVYLDSANLPSEVMLQWYENGSWEHRAYWGANNIGWGADGTASRLNMGSLPPAGQWVRLEVEASAVGLGGKTLNGMAFTLDGGRASWDKTGKTAPPTVTSRSPAAGATNVILGANVTVTFSEAMNPATVNGSTVELRDPSNALVPATVSYNADSFTATLALSAPLSQGVTYTARVRGGGSDPRVKDVAGNALAADVTWTFTTTQSGIKWLVTDHLGSTRMVIDETGSLAGIKRNDFAPFGEVLTAGPGIRSENNGYSGDSVRQKFGSKERDNETGLDFFEARYFSSVQGRFTSPDEFQGGPIELFSIAASTNPTFYADLTNPQSLNKYQYCYNNPLRYTDPNGHAPDGDGIIESIKNYLWSLLKDKVNWKTEEEPKRSDPSIAGAPSGDKIVEKHFESLVTISEINADIIMALDPIGTTSVLMNYIKGDNRGVAIAAIGWAGGVFGQFGKAGTLRASEALAQIATGAAEEGITVTRAATLRATEVVIPTRQEAEKLIGAAGGVVQRVDKGANATVSTHNFPHINYTVGNQRYTVRVQSVGKEFDRTGRYKFRGGIRQPEQ